MVLERGEDGGWGASFPELDGLFVVGDTRAEVLDLAPEAIEAYLGELRAAGSPTPRPHADVVAVEVPGSDS